MLLNKAVLTIDEGKKSGQFQPQKTTLFKWTVDKFNYTENGVGSTSATGQDVQKDDWSKSTFAVIDYIKSLDVYHALKPKLQTEFPKLSIEEFNSILHLFVRDYFDGKVGTDDIETIKKSIIDNLNGKPSECGAKVELLGLTLAVPFIDLHHGIIIRQTQKEDLERENSTYFGGNHGFDHNYPTAIMNIIMHARQPAELQQKIADAEHILRLFTVAGVHHKRYDMFSKAYSVGFRGWGFSSITSYPSVVGHIRENDIERLRRFWDVLKDQVSRFRVGEASTFRHIAYQRYNDAILKSTENVERRISDCMMGLESIFLRDGGEQQELSYRLALRTARFYGLLGFDPFKIKKMIKDSYEIRSRFVHGGVLSYEDAKKIAEKYDSLQSLLNRLLDLLRIAIVITLLIRIEKPEMIDRIDNSFLSLESENQLKGMIRSYENLFSL